MPRLARRLALAAAAALALAGAADAWPKNAPTCIEDIRAAKLLKQRLEGLSPRWKANLRTWQGAGDDCLECDDDPCGDSWHGNWIGLECRGDWVCDEWDWCEWSGPGAAAGDCKKVTNFHLPDRGLEGNVPIEMLYFPNIHEVDLDSNNLQGPIPEWVACMDKLIEFDIEENQLTGTLPPALGNLKNLQEFEVDDNPYLHGCIPDGLPQDETWGEVSFSSDPKIGTSYGGTRISGERCPTGPLPDCATLRQLPADAPWPNWVPAHLRTGGAAAGADEAADEAVAEPAAAADEEPAAAVDEEPAAAVDEEEPAVVTVGDLSELWQERLAMNQTAAAEEAAEEVPMTVGDLAEEAAAAVPADPFPAEPTEETRSVNSLNSMIAELLAGDN